MAVALALQDQVTFYSEERLMVASAGSLPTVGTYPTALIAHKSVLLARDSGGEIHARPSVPASPYSYMPRLRGSPSASVFHHRRQPALDRTGEAVRAYPYPRHLVGEAANAIATATSLFTVTRFRTAQLSSPRKCAVNGAYNRPQAHNWLSQRDAART